MTMTSDRAKARRLVLWRRVLLVVAVLASAVTAVAVGFGMYLIIEAYAGPSDPESLGGLAFLLGAGVLVIAGLPAAVTCGLAWAGYAAAARRSRSPYR